MKKMKKTAILCMALMLAFSMTFASVVLADDPATSETTTETAEETTTVLNELPNPVFELIAETDKVALYADKKIGEIKLVDKISGTEWYSNPQDKSASIDIGENKERIYSQFSIEYAQAYNLLTTNSSMECLKYTKTNSIPCLSTKAFNVLAGFDKMEGHENVGFCDALSFELVDNGIKFIYKMPKFGFKIVLQHTVKDDYLESKILMDESVLSSIHMEKQVVGGFQTRITEIDYNVTRIDLLPMFGAGRVGEEGSMFVPDESGVIINYNNGKENYAEYDMPVYGRYYETKEYARRSSGVYMPVFGNIKPEGTLMGVVTEGAPAAFVRAYVAGKNTEFNNAYSSAQVFVIESNVGETEGVPYAKSLFGEESDYTVRYYPLAAENGGYVGMANKYRDYLVNEKGMKAKTEEASSKVFLDMYAQVNKDKNILGIPVEMPEPLTSYEDVINIIEELKEAGVDQPTIRYSNWQSTKNDGKVAAKVKLSSYLGGKGKFDELLEYVEENNIAFYPSIDYVNFSEGTLKYSKFANSIKKLDQSPTTITRSRVPVKLGSKWYLLKPLTLKEGIATYFENYKKYNIGGIGLDSIGSMVYSDYSKGSTARVDTAKVWEEVFANAKETAGRVLFEEANAYAFPYADVILKSPSTDAYCEIADYTVPFYQMVLHGYVNFGTEAVNLSATPEYIRLKGIETGAALTYSVFASPASDVKGTYMDYLFSANFDLIKGTIAENYNNDKAYYDKITGQPIVNHEILATNVTCTTFKNGVKAIVNYTDSPVVLEDGTTVEAESYIVQ